MQEIHIKLLDSAAECERMPDYSGNYTISYVPGVTENGWPVIDIDNGKEIWRLTARNLWCIVGAVRGRMARDGVLNVDVNPPLAIATQRGSGVVHFAFETPFQSFDYTTEHAKQFWRELRRVAEESQQ